MIKEIDLAELPCFGEEEMLSNLTTINYLYGPNGSGKTTVSQCLADYEPGNSSSISWVHQPKTIKVYNRSFVRSSFTGADGEEPGVFLLGDDSREISERIDVLEGKRRAIQEKLQKRNESLDGFRDELLTERTSLAESIWKLRTNIPDLLKGKMPGIKASKEKCLEKVLTVARANPQRGEHTFSILEDMAKAAFDESLTESPLFPSLPEAGWDQNALQTALEAPILGSADVPLTDLIKRLSISDWVREGMGHLRNEQNTDDVCPFCQQAVPANLVAELESIFDETYQKKLAAISAFLKDIEKTKKELSAYHGSNSDRIGSLLSKEDVAQAFRALTLAVDGVQQSTQKKLHKPSDKIDVSNISNFFDSVREFIAAANEKIASMNAIVVDRRKQQSLIVEAAWREFARGYLDSHIEGFERKNERIQKSIAGIRSSIEAQVVELAKTQEELRALTKQTTSSARVVQEINDLLAMSQFHSFKLGEASTKLDGYRIIRDDGQPANIETLSEGERTFITFLYFYHSLSAVRQEGETEDIVAVVDDPISSLDGEIMFVVSALMRRLVQEVRGGQSQRVKQVIMLTHSTRFHNEVCYQHHGELSPSIKFYRIRKFSPDPNKLEDCGQKNPIRTAYQELWDEVAAAESRPEGNMPWLPNVLRRILESYFTTLGGRGNLYELGEEMPVNERTLHEALIAWSHSGSHTIMDSEIYAQVEADNSRWLRVFARIFEKDSGGAHLGHYEMMLEGARKHL